MHKETVEMTIWSSMSKATLIFQITKQYLPNQQKQLNSKYSNNNIQ